LTLAKPAQPFQGLPDLETGRPAPSWGAAAACAVNTAAASTETARTGSSQPKLGISAETMCQAPSHSSAALSSRRRSMPATTAASSGAHSAITTPATVISCPATAALTCSERDRSLSVPAVTITPQPIAKLPNISDQRAPARRRAPSAVALAAGSLNGSP